MQKCANCGHQNRPGIIYCENCGASLSGQKPLDTKSIEGSTEEEKKQMGVDESVLTDVRVQGAATFSEKDFLRLEVEGSPEPLMIKPDAETVFGRRDPATGAIPDVDLTPFAGYRMGVSRRHAVIRYADQQGLDLWDLGSSNGTYLNGERLSAHRAYRLHDGDELRLGQMLIRLRFQSAPPEKAPEVPKEEKPAESAAPLVGSETIVQTKAEAAPAQPVAAVMPPAEATQKPAEPPVTKPVTEEQQAELDAKAKDAAPEPKPELKPEPEPKKDDPGAVPPPIG
jgi:pSer/pThr/pTyr-binding forkhead associated (FHA) protein